MRTSFYVPDALAEQARTHGISVSGVARRALQKAVRDAELRVEPSIHDETRFMASVLQKALTSDQIIDLIEILAESRQ